MFVDSASGHEKVIAKLTVVPWLEGQDCGGAVSAVAAARRLAMRLPAYAAETDHRCRIFLDRRRFLGAAMCTLDGRCGI
jgi:hypothetical protein